MNLKNRLFFLLSIYLMAASAYAKDQYDWVVVHVFPNEKINIIKGKADVEITESGFEARVIFEPSNGKRSIRILDGIFEKPVSVNTNKYFAVKLVARLRSEGQSTLKYTYSGTYRRAWMKDTGDQYAENSTDTITVYEDGSYIALVKVSPPYKGD